MTEIKGMEAVLAHLHARAEQGQPLFGDPAEEAFSRYSGLGRSGLYRKIKTNYSQGKSLARALAEVRGFPEYLLNLIGRGEESGRLARSLRLALNHYPLLNRFGPHLGGLAGYIFTVLLFIAFFLVYFSLLFSRMHLWVVAENQSVRPDMFELSLLGQYPGVVAAAGLTMIVVLLVWRLFFKQGLIVFLARNIPLVRDNYFNLLSLELGTLYLFNLESGLTPTKALALAASGIKDRAMRRSITNLAAEIERGQPYSQALAGLPRIWRLPLIGCIGLGQAAGRPGEMVENMVRLLEKDLTANLNRDMKTVFNCTVLACGTVTGLAVVYAFKAILETYSWALY